MQPICGHRRGWNMERASAQVVADARQLLSVTVRQSPLDPRRAHATCVPRARAGSCRSCGVAWCPSPRRVDDRVRRATLLADAEPRALRCRFASSGGSAATGICPPIAARSGVRQGLRRRDSEQTPDDAHKGCKTRDCGTHKTTAFFADRVSVEPIRCGGATWDLFRGLSAPGHASRCGIWPSGRRAGELTDDLSRAHR